MACTCPVRPSCSAAGLHRCLWIILRSDSQRLMGQLPADLSSGPQGPLPPFGSPGWCCAWSGQELLAVLAGATGNGSKVACTWEMGPGVAVHGKGVASSAPHPGPKLSSCHQGQCWGWGAGAPIAGPPFMLCSLSLFADSFVNSQEWTLSRSVPELKVVSTLVPPTPSF